MQSNIVLYLDGVGILLVISWRIIDGELVLPPNASKCIHLQYYNVVLDTELNGSITWLGAVDQIIIHQDLDKKKRVSSKYCNDNCKLVLSIAVW